MTLKDVIETIIGLILCSCIGVGLWVLLMKLADLTERGSPVAEFILGFILFVIIGYAIRDFVKFIYEGIKEVDEKFKKREKEDYDQDL